ncbi:dienelactone hydrolase family protein [Streptomyces sp. ID05-39B]|uniref:dienelactone hydrolase family protein n=1 Tax=Streptomyces sp. ID05-39B TaxID=3028664 RepID=UPI0029ACCFFF|nr:dienelactone hydrolase family protein [Streptomyces sp. ID05-39B]MDX3529931.1 dienelactone hydrolase family protein [Streptomyces sp. ID05-39B]
MSGPEPVGRRALAGTGAALLAGQAGVAQAAVADGPLPGFHPALKDALTFPLAWGNSPIRDFRTWRRAARAKVEETLLVDREDATPYAPEFQQRTEQGGYTGELVTLSLTRHERVRAALLTPHGPGPFPAVLLLHDHGATFDIGKEKLVRPWYDGARLASARAWTEKYFSGRFVGDELARRGYVVLVADALGWGDRGPLAYDRQQALASNLYHLGSSLAGLMAREDARAAGFLARLQRVDRGRIAAVGFSMGAFRAWQAAALTDDLAATAAVCWMTGLKEMMVPGNNTLRGQSSYCMLHPGLSRHLDFPDVASIAAPRPMLFFDGGLDPLFPADGVRVAHEKLRAVWRSRHAEERLHLRTWPDLGHVFTDRMQDEVFTWLDHVL